MSNTWSEIKKKFAQTENTDTAAASDNPQSATTTPKKRGRPAATKAKIEVKQNTKKNPANGNAKKPAPKRVKIEKEISDDEDALAPWAGKTIFTPPPTAMDRRFNRISTLHESFWDLHYHGWTPINAFEGSSPENEGRAFLEKYTPDNIAGEIF